MNAIAAPARLVVTGVVLPIRVTVFYTWPICMDATIRSNIIATLIVLAIQKRYVERLNKSM